MPKIRILKGADQFKKFYTGKVSEEHREKIKKIFKNGGSEVVKDLKRVIETGTRSGRTYKYKGVAYVASAPGEPPANRSGTLSGGFDYVSGSVQLTVFSEVVSEKGYNYPLALEEGTPGGKIKPRPYFDITCRSNAYKIQKDLQRHVI